MAKQNETPSRLFPVFPRRFITALAEEVAKRLPSILSQGKKKRAFKQKRIEYSFFLDTSAIVDGRIFDVVSLGFLQDAFVVLEEVLLELKHIADHKDSVKKERGRKGLEMLENLKKNKRVKVVVLPRSKTNGVKEEVDEMLIAASKANKGRLITCDYNLEKKASIQGVMVVNVNALAQALKVRAVPGDQLTVKIQHVGKDATQGVAYLDDGTMIVVERGVSDIGQEISITISRIIQTAAGRILFAKKI